MSRHARQLRATPRSLLAGVLALAVAGPAAWLLLGRVPAVLLVAPFPRARRLITNERAYVEPGAPGTHRSRYWEVTSGSLFSSDGAGWTGVPDGIAPNVDSSNGTDSAVFRMITRQADFADVQISFDLRIAGLVTTPRTPATAYDGVHVFLRYHSDRHLYVASIYRRDGVVAVKEKVPGGPSNGGTYYTLAEARHKMPWHRWIPVSVSIVTLAGRAVRIAMTIGSRLVLTATSHPGRAAPILTAGRVGLRGDNCEFYFRDFTVSAASP